MRWPWSKPSPRVSPLLRAARIPRVPATDDPAYSTVLEILRRTAEAFLRSGGVLDLETFADLGPEERAVFITAGQAVAADRAAALGLATQGALGAAAVLAETDGGAARTRVILSEAVDAALAGVRR